MNEDQVHRREPLLSVNKEPDASLFLCVDEGTEEEGLLRITPIGAPISPRRFKLLEEVGDEGAYVIGCPRILALVEVDPIGSAFEELLQGECFARDLRPIIVASLTGPRFRPIASFRRYAAYRHTRQPAPAEEEVRRRASEASIRWKVQRLRVIIAHCRPGGPPRPRCCD